MKAVEHAIQAGTSSTNGCRSAAIAAGMSTGIRIVAVAVLLAISVRNVTVKHEKAAVAIPPVPEARARLAEYYVRRSLSIILASSCLLAPFNPGACFDSFHRR